MKYPVTLQPAGVIPRDPNLVLRLTPLPPEGEAATPAVECPVAEINPCCVTGTGDPTFFDGFTGTSNIAAHTSDSGATYTQTSGNTAPDTYQVDGTVLRRQDFGEGGDSLGEAWIVPSQQPTTSRYYVEAKVRFKGNLNGDDPLYSSVAFYQQGDSPGNEDILCNVSSQGLGFDAGLLAPDNSAYETAPRAWYRMRLYVDDTTVTLCINAELVAGPVTLDAAPVLPIALDTFNFGGTDNFEIDYFTIVDV